MSIDNDIKKIVEMSDIKCPGCSCEVFERVMDTKVVDQACYEDGKLEVTQKSFDVHESFIRCSRCSYEFDKVEHEQLLAEIEEMFL